MKGPQWKSLFWPFFFEFPIFSPCMVAVPLAGRRRKSWRNKDEKREEKRVGRGNQGRWCGENLAKAISYPGHYLASTTSLLGFTWVIICEEGGLGKVATRKSHPETEHSTTSETEHWVDGAWWRKRALVITRSPVACKRGGQANMQAIHPAELFGGKLGLPDPNAAAGGLHSSWKREGIICRATSEGANMQSHPTTPITNNAQVQSLHNRMYKSKKK